MAATSSGTSADRVAPRSRTAPGSSGVRSAEARPTAHSDTPDACGPRPPGRGPGAGSLLPGSAFAGTTLRTRRTPHRRRPPSPPRKVTVQPDPRPAAFIQRNLHDPELSPSAIAGAHHISVSYLHRLFTQESQGETVAAWIRRQRLEKARRDLADPALCTLPVHAVAARWGIPRAADFSRGFRAAYGLSPTEHRQRALSGGESE
ncbi:hypothetical protein C7C46_14400 [Streptomyces tateyamensis]|uniref:HTH araC/xylS-type domain-containing protein n=1 Tax=Streptomyces tateyamensis TaxID=565073 RepID=A0A2V4N5L8_9ACTN|nr:hypothetical protein C7C46_14400 [Streptomyces tateyamensis]